MREDFNQWQSAQSAEKEHYEAFEDRQTWSTSRAEQYMNKHYDIEMAELYGESVLEVGCGLGLIHGLKKCERIGIDPLGQHLGQHLTEGDAEIIEGVGESVPFPDNYFNTVFCINALDHCVSPSAVLSEIRRVLTNNGQLFITINTFQIPSFIRRRLTHIDRPHQHHYSHKEIVELVEENSFQVQHDSSRSQTVDTRSIKTTAKTSIAIHVCRMRISSIKARFSGNQR